MNLEMIMLGEEARPKKYLMCDSICIKSLEM